MALIKPLFSVSTLTLAVILGLLAYTTWEGFKLWETAQFNQALAQIDSITVKDQANPILIAAKANWHDRRGNTMEALRLYNQILPRTQGKLRANLAYNLGSLYLREAANYWNQSGVWAYSRVQTLLGLARQYLREAVRLDPSNRDACYHLEYALRITLPPREREASKWQGTKASVFATMPGIPKGGP